MDVSIVNSIAELQALAAPTAASATTIAVSGYYAAGDGGGGDFVWDPTSSLPDDRNMVINPPSHPGSGRWLRRVENGGEINVRWFGARGDGFSGDDTAFVQKALDYQRVNDGEVILPPGDYNITSTLTFFTSNRANALRMRGFGRDASRLFCSITNRTSLLKIRGSVSSQFMWGGHIKALSIVAFSTQPYWSQQAAIDLGNCVEMLIEDCGISGIAGHGIWACEQNTSVNNNDGLGVDLPNDKPWVTVDRFRPTGRPAHLQARVNFKQTTGRVTNNSDIITTVADTSGFTAGATAFISGDGIPPDTNVTAIGAGQFTLSKKAIKDVASATLSINTDGAVTGFRIYRIGSGYRDGDAITVRGCGTGFVGKAKTSFTLNATISATDPNNLVTGIFLSGSGNTVMNSNLVTVTTGTTGIAKGCSVSGTGIPTGATVVRVVDFDMLQLSANATATNTGVVLTIGGTVGKINGKVQVGYHVRGTGVPDGTVVTAVGSANTLNLSATPTSSLVGTPLTFYSPDYGFTSATGNTHSNTSVDGLGSTAELVAGYVVSGPGIVPGTTILSVNSGTAITLSQAATATATGVALSFISPNGGVVDYEIVNSGANYYESNDHLFDNPDPYTTAHTRIIRTEIVNCDGVGLVFPHFSSSGLSVENCTISGNMEGGVVFGGNGFDMKCTGVSTNGMHFEEGGPGFYPGVWLRRTDSSAEMIRLSQNEFDSNTYCHVLLDGVDGAEISFNRCNSWVTAWPINTDWQSQIPGEQIKFDPGNASSANTGIIVSSNRHRSQPQGASVPQTSVTTIAGQTVVVATRTSPLGSSTFKVGARVEILNGSTPISFGGHTSSETTITVITPPISNRAGNTVNGSATISGIVTTGVIANAPISGPGIPTGAHVLTVAANSLTMSANATATSTTPVLLAFAGTMTLALPPDMTISSGGTMIVLINDEGVTGVDLGANSLTAATDVVNPLNAIAGEHGALVANWRNALGTGITYRLNGAQLFGNPGTGAASGRINIGTFQLLPGGGAQTAVTWTVTGDPEHRFGPGGTANASRYLPNTSGVFQVAGCLTVDSTVAVGDGFEIRLVQESNDLSLAGVAAPRVGSPNQLETIEYWASKAGSEFSMPFTFSSPVTVLNPYIGQNRPSQQLSSGMDGMIWWDPETKRQWRWNGTLLIWQLVAGQFTDPFDPNTRLSVQVVNKRTGGIQLSGGTQGLQNYITFKQVG